MAEAQIRLSVAIDNLKNLKAQFDQFKYITIEPTLDAKKVRQTMSNMTGQLGEGMSQEMSRVFQKTKGSFVDMAKSSGIQLQGALAESTAQLGQIKVDKGIGAVSRKAYRGEFVKRFQQFNGIDKEGLTPLQRMMGQLNNPNIGLDRIAQIMETMQGMTNLINLFQSFNRVNNNALGISSVFSESGSMMAGRDRKTFNNYIKQFQVFMNAALSGQDVDLSAMNTLSNNVFSNIEGFRKRRLEQLTKVEAGVMKLEDVNKSGFSDFVESVGGNKSQSAQAQSTKNLIAVQRVPAHELFGDLVRSSQEKQALLSGNVPTQEREKLQGRKISMPTASYMAPEDVIQQDRNNTTGSKDGIYLVYNTSQMNETSAIRKEKQNRYSIKPFAIQVDQNDSSFVQDVVRNRLAAIDRFQEIIRGNEKLSNAEILPQDFFESKDNFDIDGFDKWYEQAYANNLPAKLAMAKFISNGDKTKEAELYNLYKGDGKAYLKEVKKLFDGMYRLGVADENGEQIDIGEKLTAQSYINFLRKQYGQNSQFSVGDSLVSTSVVPSKSNVVAMIPSRKKFATSLQQYTEQKMRGDAKRIAGEDATPQKIDEIYNSIAAQQQEAVQNRKNKIVSNMLKQGIAQESITQQSIQLELARTIQNRVNRGMQLDKNATYLQRYIEAKALNQKTNDENDAVQAILKLMGVKTQRFKSNDQLLSDLTSIAEKRNGFSVKSGVGATISKPIEMVIAPNQHSQQSTNQSGQSSAAQSLQNQADAITDQTQKQAEQASAEATAIDNAATSLENAVAGRTNAQQASQTRTNEAVAHAQAAQDKANAPSALKASGIDPSEGARAKVKTTPLKQYAQSMGLMRNMPKELKEMFAKGADEKDIQQKAKELLEQGRTIQAEDYERMHAQENLRDSLREKLGFGPGFEGSVPPQKRKDFDTMRNAASEALRLEYKIRNFDNQYDALYGLSTFRFPKEQIPVADISTPDTPASKQSTKKQPKIDFKAQQAKLREIRAAKEQARAKAMAEQTARMAADAQAALISESVNSSAGAISGNGQQSQPDLLQRLKTAGFTGNGKKVPGAIMAAIRQGKNIDDIISMTNSWIETRQSKIQAKNADIQNYNDRLSSGRDPYIQYVGKSTKGVDNATYSKILNANNINKKITNATAEIEEAKAQIANLEQLNELFGQHKSLAQQTRPQVPAPQPSPVLPVESSEQHIEQKLQQPQQPKTDTAQATAQTTSVHDAASAGLQKVANAAQEAATSLGSIANVALKFSGMVQSNEAVVVPEQKVQPMSLQAQNSLNTEASLAIVPVGQIQDNIKEHRARAAMRQRIAEIGSSSDNVIAMQGPQVPMMLPAPPQGVQSLLTPGKHPRRMTTAQKYARLSVSKDTGLNVKDFGEEQINEVNRLVTKWTQEGNLITEQMVANLDKQLKAERASKQNAGQRARVKAVQELRKKSAELAPQAFKRTIEQKPSNPSWSIIPAAESAVVQPKVQTTAATTSPTPPNIPQQFPNPFGALGDGADKAREKLVALDKELQQKSIDLNTVTTAAKGTENTFDDMQSTVSEGDAVIQNNLLGLPEPQIIMGRKRDRAVETPDVIELRSAVLNTLPPPEEILTPSPKGAAQTPPVIYANAPEGYVEPTQVIDAVGSTIEEVAPVDPFAGVAQSAQGAASGLEKVAGAAKNAAAVLNSIKGGKPAGGGGLNPNQAPAVRSNKATPVVPPQAANAEPTVTQPPVPKVEEVVIQPPVQEPVVVQTQDAQIGGIQPPVVDTLALKQEQEAQTRIANFEKAEKAKREAEARAQQIRQSLGITKDGDAIQNKLEQLNAKQQQIKAEEYNKENGDAYKKYVEAEKAAKEEFSASGLDNPFKVAHLADKQKENIIKETDKQIAVIDAQQNEIEGKIAASKQAEAKAKASKEAYENAVAANNKYQNMYGQAKNRTKGQEQKRQLDKALEIGKYPESWNRRTNPPIRGQSEDPDELTFKKLLDAKNAVKDIDEKNENGLTLKEQMEADRKAAEEAAKLIPKEQRDKIPALNAARQNAIERQRNARNAAEASANKQRDNAQQTYNQAVEQAEAIYKTESAEEEKNFTSEKNAKLQKINDAKSQAKELLDIEGKMPELQGDYDKAWAAKKFAEYQQVSKRELDAYQNLHDIYARSRGQQDFWDTDEGNIYKRALERSGYSDKQVTSNPSFRTTEEQMWLALTNHKEYRKRKDLDKLQDLRNKAEDAGLNKYDTRTQLLRDQQKSLGEERKNIRKELEDYLFGVKDENGVRHGGVQDQKLKAYYKNLIDNDDLDQQGRAHSVNEKGEETWQYSRIESHNILDGVKRQDEPKQQQPPVNPPNAPQPPVNPPQNNPPVNPPQPPQPPQPPVNPPQNNPPKPPKPQKPKGPKYSNPIEKARAMRLQIAALQMRDNYDRLWGDAYELDDNGNPIQFKGVDKNGTAVKKKLPAKGAKVKNTDTYLEKLISDLEKGKISKQDASKQLQKLDPAFKNNLKNATDQLRGLNSLDRAQREYKQFEAIGQKGSFRKNADYQTLLGQYKSAMEGKEVNRLSDLRRQLNSMSKTTTRTQTLAGGVGGAFSSMLGMYDITSYMGLQRVIGKFKELASVVAQVDAAMISLKKVTTATDTSYDKYLSNALSKSQELSVSVSSYIKGTTEFAKLGYNLQESQQLGQVALKYANVGDDVQGIEGASSSLIATLKAFKLESKQASNIADKYNAAGNNFAISAGDAGQIMQKSAAALNSAGNDIDQSLALGIGMAEVNQDAGKTGSALKTVALRLRGSKAELESEGESSDGVVVSTSKLRAQIKALTKTRSNQKGVDILDAAGNYKSTYEIMQGIASVWQEIGPNSTNGAALLELIAGKNRSSDVAGMLNNWESVEKAYTTMQNATGSVDEEYGTWSEGIQAKKQKLQSAKEGFATSFVDSDGMKSMYDMATGILNIFTKITSSIGSWPSIAATVGGLLGLSKGSSVNMYNAWQGAQQAIGAGTYGHGKIRGTLGAMLKGTSTNGDGNVVIGGTGSTGGLAQIAGSIGGTLLTSAIFGVVTAIGSKISSIINNQKQKQAKAIEAGKVSYENYQATAKENLSNKKYVKENADQFSRLYSGVDNTTGKNKTLTDEEYKTYTTIANKLAEIFPSLASGIDESGNSIINLESACSALGITASTTKQQLEQLSDAYGDLKLYQTIKDVGTFFGGYYKKLVGTKGNTLKESEAGESLKGKRAIQGVQMIFSAIDYAQGEKTSEYSFPSNNRYIKRMKASEMSLNGDWNIATNQQLQQAGFAADNEATLGVFGYDTYGIAKDTLPNTVYANLIQIVETLKEADVDQEVIKEIESYKDWFGKNKDNFGIDENNFAWWNSLGPYYALQDKTGDSTYFNNGKKTQTGTELSDKRTKGIIQSYNSIVPYYNNIKTSQVASLVPIKDRIASTLSYLSDNGWLANGDSNYLQLIKGMVTNGKLTTAQLFKLIGIDSNTNFDELTLSDVATGIDKSMSTIWGTDSSALLTDFLNAKQQFENGQINYGDVISAQQKFFDSLLKQNDRDLFDAFTDSSKYNTYDIAQNRLQAMGIASAEAQNAINNMDYETLQWITKQKDFGSIDAGSNSANIAFLERMALLSGGKATFKNGVFNRGSLTDEQVLDLANGAHVQYLSQQKRSYSGVSATLQQEETFKQSLNKISSSIGNGQVPEASKLMNVISNIAGEDTSVEGIEAAIDTFNGLFMNGQIDSQKLAKLNSSRAKDNIDLIDEAIGQLTGQTSAIARYESGDIYNKKDNVNGIKQEDYTQALQQVAVLKQIRTLLDGQITNTIATGMKNVQTYTENAIAVGKDIDANKEISYDNITKLKEAGLIDSAFKYAGEEQQGDNGETRTLKFTYDTNELMSAQLEKIRTARDGVSEELYEAQADFLKKQQQYEQGKGTPKEQELKQALSDAETKMFELAGIMQDYTAQEIKIIKNNEGARGVTAFNSYTSAIDSVASGFLSNGQIDIDNWMKLDSQTQATMFKRRNTTATAWEINSEGKQIGTPNQPYQFSGYEIDYDAIFASKTLALSQALDMCSSTINNFTDQYEKATGKQKDTIAAQIKAYKIMQQSLKDTYSTLDKFKAAQGTANKGDNFRSSKSALDTMKQAINSGRYNTDDFYGAYEYYYGQEAANALREGTINKSDIKKKYYQTKTRFYDSTGNLNVNKSLEYLAGAGVIKKQGNKYIPDASLSVKQMVEKSGYDAGFLKDLFGAMSQYSLNNDQRAFADSMYQQFRDYMINDLGMSADEVDANMLLGEQLDTVNITAGTVNIQGTKQQQQYRDSTGNIVTVNEALNSGIIQKVQGGYKTSGEGLSSTISLTPEAALSLAGYKPYKSQQNTATTQVTAGGASSDQTQGDGNGEANGAPKEAETRARVIPDFSLFDNGMAQRTFTTAEVDISADTSNVQQSINEFNGQTIQLNSVMAAGQPNEVINSLNGKTIHLNAVIQKVSGSVGAGDGDGGSPIAMVDGGVYNGRSVVSGASFAGGTDAAPNGNALVGELGPEIIVDRKSGSWRLAQTPQLTRLNKGDIVFNASQTKKILSGNKSSYGAEIGSSFVNGGVVGGRSYAGDEKNDSAGGSFDHRSNKPNNVNWDKIIKQLESVYDWIVQKLKVLKQKTTDYFNAVSQQVGALSKVSQLDKALQSTKEQLAATRAAQAKYTQYFNYIVKKLQLSNATVKKIKNGQIDITELSDDPNKMGSRIKQAATWWEKVENAQQNITTLAQQVLDYARKKLEEIANYYDKRQKRAQSLVDAAETQRELKKAKGRQITANDYNDSLTGLYARRKELTFEREHYLEQFNALVADGTIKVDSDAYHEAIDRLEQMDKEIIKSNKDIAQMNNEILKLPIIVLDNMISRLSAIQEGLEGINSFHDAQGVQNVSSSFVDLIKNGYEQIKVWEQQNKLLEKQMKGLDENSERYQELRGQFESNSRSILGMKTSMESWNDSILQLEIDKLQKQRQELEKENEVLQVKKNLNEALEDLEKARTQRTKLIYRQGKHMPCHIVICGQ